MDTLNIDLMRLKRESFNTCDRPTSRTAQEV